MDPKQKFNDFNCLVIGTGSIGTRHAYNLKKLGIRNISIYDVNKHQAKKNAKNLKLNYHSDFRTALLSKPDVCFICTYPSTHIKIAEKCVRNGSHLFIEKPLSTNLNNVKSLLNQIEKNKIKIAIGYNLRYDPGLTEIKKIINSNRIGRILSVSSQWGHHIKNWHKGRNFKNHYILKSNVGIILDDSHEYDYLRWILNDEVKSVYCQTNKSKTLKANSESIASMMLRFRKGPIATVTLDYIRPKYERSCHIIGEKGSIKWESLQIEKNSSKSYSNLSLSKISIINSNGQNLENSFKFKSNKLYVDELKNFFSYLNNENKILSDGFDGLKTLKIGLAALESSKKNKIINL